MFLIEKRWIGDYGGQKQKFFPANYCEEINYVAEEEQDVNEDEMNGEDDSSEVRKCCFKVLFSNITNAYRILYIYTGVKAAHEDKPHPEFGNLNFGKKIWDRIKINQKVSLEKEVLHTIHTN